MTEQAAHVHGDALTTLEDLLDMGVIDRWATLFATRYQTPNRQFEFSTHIVGTMLDEPHFARRGGFTPAEIDELFQHARNSIETFVGRPMFSVSSRLRDVYRAERAARAKDTPTGTLPVFA